MDKIKLAEETIKHLKDFIEIEKVSKKVVTNIATKEIDTLSKNIISEVEKNIVSIKGE